MIQRIKGTQDWLDLRLFNFLMQRVTDHLAYYNYTHIRTPILEPTELFKRSLGVATDVVSKEMFIVKTAQNDDSICLRPEATASTVRAFIEHGITEVPWRVFSSGAMFRYERPQKGRYREFHQVSIENIGASSINHDAELIKMLDRLFREQLQLDNYQLAINFLGSYEDRAVYKEQLKNFLASDQVVGICDTCSYRKDTNMLRIFDCKNDTCKNIYSSAPRMIDYLSNDTVYEWQQLQERLELFAVPYIINPFLVRGLDYYNKTVFEFASNDLGAQNAFCGGGRYDSLVKELSGKQEQPAIGAAIGIERILLLLETRQHILSLPEKPVLTVVIPLAQEQITSALLLADQLHCHKKCTEVLLDGGSIKSMLRKANKMGATYAVIIGHDEQQAQEVTLKHMINGTEQRIKQTVLLNHIV